MHEDAQPVTGRVEAARYALLRRLAQAMGHRMLAHVRPIDMLAHLIGRRLHEEAPDLQRVAADMDSLQRLARSAVDVNLDVVSWIAPDPQQAIAFDAGVAESVTLLRGHFGFRGYELALQLAGVHDAVPRAAMRTVLPALLFALMDGAPLPAQMQLATRVDATGPVLEVTLAERPGLAPLEGAPPYRPLQWEEVQALADAEGARVTRGPHGARLQFA